MFGMLPKLKWAKQARLQKADSTTALRERKGGAPTAALKNRVGSAAILFVADFFQPVHGFAVELFLNGDVRQGRGGRGAVPMFLARRKPDDVARPNFFNRSAPALCQSAASGHDQGLAQRVRVPRGASARLKRDDGTGHSRRITALERRVNAHRAGKPVGRSFVGRL